MSSPSDAARHLPLAREDSKVTVSQRFPIRVALATARSTAGRTNGSNHPARSLSAISRILPRQGEVAGPRQPEGEESATEVPVSSPSDAARHLPLAGGG